MSIFISRAQCSPAVRNDEVIDAFRTSERLHHLFFQDFFNLADFLLDLAGYLFALTSVSMS